MPTFLVVFHASDGTLQPLGTFDGTAPPDATNQLAAAAQDAVNGASRNHGIAGKYTAVPVRAAFAFDVTFASPEPAVAPETAA